MVRAATRVMAEESQKIVDAITEKFNSFEAEMLAIVSEKNDEITSLKSELSTVKIRLNFLEEKMAKGESDSKMNNVLISGSEVPLQSNNENCIEIVRNLFANKLRNIVPTQDIISASRTGKMKPPTDNGPSQAIPIVVKFANNDTKMRVIELCRTVKPKFYVSEDLSLEKRSILYALRVAKRKFPEIVDGSYAAIGGKIYAWIKPQSSDGELRNRKVMVNTLEKLKNFCTSTLGAGLETFVSN